MNLSFSIILAAGITGAAAKINNYNAVDNKHDTIDEICAEANLPEYSKVAKLCKELGSKGLDIGMDDAVALSDGASDKLVRVRNKLAGHEGSSFSMREILEAEDAEAAYNNIVAHDMKQTERKLVVDYGWCSGSAGFLAGMSDDSSNYCDPSQDCDSSIGCGSSLSSCCIIHDRCLQGPGSGTTSRCTEVNCKGSTCDATFSSCAWNVSCCWFSRWSGYACDALCITVSTAISGAFGTGTSLSPKSSYNIDGDDVDSICHE